MRFIYIGNCQTIQLKAVSDVITSHRSFRFDVKKFNAGSLRDIPGGVKASDVVIYTDLSYLKKRMSSISDLSRATLVAVPPISFPGGMPDCVYVKSADGNIQSPIGDYHSFIAYSAYLSGLSAEQCIQLFNGKVFQDLGWYDYYASDKSRLKHELMGSGIPVELVDRWCAANTFMHTVNHPKIFVIEDIIKVIFDGLGVSYKNIPSSNLITDRLSTGPKFPLYIDYNQPDRKALGNLFYKAADKCGGYVYSLEEFVRGSYEVYRDLNHREISVQRIDERGVEFYQSVYLAYLSSVKGQIKSVDHPYKNKADHCFWRRAVSNVKASEVDPVVSSDIKISKNDRVATAGSCFAQHIAKRLDRMGFNYYIAEAASPEIPVTDHARRGYGTYSCRYGNIYTARQLLQLFDEAFGERTPRVPAWQRPDGRYVDPFRPQVDEIGFFDPHDVARERKKHLNFVKEMFLNLDVFIFTLGLTECWQYIDDASVLPLAPGVVAGEMDYERYKFVNFSMEEVRADLEQFLDKLKSVNPAARVIFTVSPVPLMATYEDRHVLQSTTLSKAVLRVAADNVVSAYGNAHYFPSYEVIAGSFNRGSYYEEDLREVTPSGVDHVMRLFVKHLTHSVNGSKHVEVGVLSPLSEAAQLNEILCDEEALDN